MLRIAAYELRHRLDVPYRVVINEAIETAKRFGSEHGHTYVNGVLDKAAAEWRAVEIRSRRRVAPSAAERWRGLCVVLRLDATAAQTRLLALGTAACKSASRKAARPQVAGANSI